MLTILVVWGIHPEVEKSLLFTSSSWISQRGWDEVHQTSHMSKDTFFSLHFSRQVLLCLLIWGLKTKHLLMYSVFFVYGEMNCFFCCMYFYGNCWKMGACLYIHCKRTGWVLLLCVAVNHEYGNLLSSPLFQEACPCHKTCDLSKLILR